MRYGMRIDTYRYETRQCQVKRSRILYKRICIRGDGDMVSTEVRDVRYVQNFP